MIDLQNALARIDLRNENLKDELLPACKSFYPRRNFIFMQDGAPSHTSNVVQELLKEELGSRFLDKTEWPPDSHDANPMDYFFGTRCQLKSTREEESPSVMLKS